MALHASVKHPLATGRHQPFACRVRPRLRMQRVATRFQPQNSSTPVLQADPQASAKAPARQILVAVDDSEESLHACRWTQSNLYRAGDKIHLVHCIPGLPHLRVSDYSEASRQLATEVKAPGGEQPTGWEEHWLADVTARIHERLGQPLQQHKVDYDVLVVSEPSAGGKGSIGELLCARAEALGAAALVVASRQRGGLQELLMGSVANYCAHHCTTPVVVLHKPQKQPPPSSSKHAEEETDWEDACCCGTLSDDPSRAEASHPTSPWGRNIVVAVDDSDAALDSCRWAAANLYRAGDRVTLCHVIPALLSSAMGFVTEGMLYPPALSPEELAAEEALWREITASRYAQMLEEAGVPYEQEVVREYSEDPPTAVGRVLCALAAARGASCIVLASHNRSTLMEMLLGSTTSYCTHHSRVPVVVLH